jgi:7,8-dihydropterin-6-yl-methyl-4-(beta-D-ribofuranosyl)aminobenzene 5'-phosphate synthase
VVISHLHADHVGGIRAMRTRTFSLSAEPLEPRGIPAYIPAPMRHTRADVAVTAGPTVIAPGMAVLPPLPRMLFWAGSISEQVLVVNVRGFGLMLISGSATRRSSGSSVSPSVSWTSRSAPWSAGCTCRCMPQVPP